LFFSLGSRALFFFSPVASSADPAVAQRSCGPAARAPLPRSPTGGGHLSSPTSGRTEPDPSLGLCRIAPARAPGHGPACRGRFRSL
jgi:hypothetical protein